MGHQVWPVGQAVKTPPFHGGIKGSIPLRVTKLRAISSAGRAPALQAGCRRFDPVIAHQLLLISCSLHSVVEAKEVFDSRIATRLARSVQMLGALSTVAEAYCKYVEQRSGSSSDADGRLLTDAYASVAQSVEQRTENPRVGSSILP